MTLSPDYDAHAADPFGERWRYRYSMTTQILGARFRFESTSRALLDLVEATYQGLPAQGLPDSAQTFVVELRLLERRTACATDAPPPVQTQSGAGVLCGVMDDCNYTVIVPGERRAVVVASEDMLQHAYHLRYELIEFAVFMLAARGSGLVSLHGACIGLQGRGLLLLGSSGAGKSTLALHGMLQGFEFLAEDAVFVQPEHMHAMGVGNYLHVKDDALRLLDDEAAKRWITGSSVIRRRSGVEKFEADVRQWQGAVLADAPMTLAGAIFVCGDYAEDPDELLTPVSDESVAERLAADQAYAAGQPGFAQFVRRIASLGVYELRRGRQPSDAIHALRQFLAGATRQRAVEVA
jgi:hypothetical protein